MTPHYRDRNIENNDDGYMWNNSTGQDEDAYIRRTSKLGEVMENRDYEDVNSLHRTDKKNSTHRDNINDDEFKIRRHDGENGLSLEERKKNTQKKQKESAALQKKAIIFASATVAFFAVVCIIAVLIVAKVNESKQKPNDKNSVVWVDGEFFQKNKFLFFCSTVIGGDTFDEIAETSQDSSVIGDCVKENAVDLIEEYVCKVHEAKKAGVQLTQKEKKEVRDSIVASCEKDDDYTMKYYGMTFDEYYSLCCDMQLLGKYIDELSKSAPIDENSQKTVFEQNENIMSSTEIKMIYFDISKLDETELAQRRLNAQTMFTYVKEGSDISKLSIDYSDENDLFNATEHGGDITVTLDYYDKDKYGELCKSVAEMKVGEVKLVETANEICVVLCEKKNGFESMVNSDELIQMTKQVYIANHFDTIMESGVYSANINEKLYKKVNIVSYVQAALEAD